MPARSSRSGLRKNAWYRRLAAVLFDWYERHYHINLAITTGLFMLQLVHLYWLTTHVVAFRLLGQSYFNPSPFWEAVIIIVDYTEIPALISTSVLYLFEMKKKFEWRQVFFLIALNSQWLHLFWITDEFVIDRFSGMTTGTILPLWLAWLAICIDYLELPVIVDTIAKTIRTFRRRGLTAALREVGD